MSIHRCQPLLPSLPVFGMLDLTVSIAIMFDNKIYLVLLGETRRRRADAT
jgi:hypothetical protein